MARGLKESNLPSIFAADIAEVATEVGTKDKLQSDAQKTVALKGLGYAVVATAYLAVSWFGLDSIVKAPHPTADQIRQYGIDHGPATLLPTPTLVPRASPTPRPK